MLGVKYVGLLYTQTGINSRVFSRYCDRGVAAPVARRQPQNHTDAGSPSGPHVPGYCVQPWAQTFCSRCSGFRVAKAPVVHSHTLAPIQNVVKHMVEAQGTRIERPLLDRQKQAWFVGCELQFLHCAAGAECARRCQPGRA